MCYHSSDFETIWVTTSYATTLYKCFHFLTIGTEVHRKEVATMSIDALSNDNCVFPLSKSGFSRVTGVKGIFFLEIQSRFFTSVVGARPLSSPLWVTGAKFNHSWFITSLVTWLSRTVSYVFPFSENRDVMSSFTFETPDDNIFMTSWEVLGFSFLITSNGISSVLVMSSGGFNIGKDFIFTQASWIWVTAGLRPWRGYFRGDKCVSLSLFITVLRL